MARISQIVNATNGLTQFNSGGTSYVVQTNSGALYFFCIDRDIDVVYKKSSDGGLTWSENVVLFAGTGGALAVWYDRWSDIAAGLIHVAYVDNATHDTLYRSVNTESADALSTQTVIFAGASATTGGALSITRARGGNLLCYTCIDAGVEGGFYRSTDVGGTWGVRTIPEALASGDQMILMPGFAADTQDILGIFWDASANEINRYVYDDSANTQTKTFIATMTETAVTVSFPHFAATPDLTNSRLIMVAWSNVDSANADLRCWTISETAITETTANVVLNSVDDQGLCAVGLNTITNVWYVIYAGKSDGSETINTAVNVYMKTSSDSGATWSAETALTTIARNVRWLVTTPRFIGEIIIAYNNDIPIDELRVDVVIPITAPIIGLNSPIIRIA